MPDIRNAQKAVTDLAAALLETQARRELVPGFAYDVECDGMDVEYNGYEVTYYITEYEMDNGIAGGNPAMPQ